jgi:hypothetical protein
MPNEEMSELSTAWPLSPAGDTWGRSVKDGAYNEVVR